MAGTDTIGLMQIKMRLRSLLLLPLPSVILAAWSLRQSWRLLAIVQLGALVAVAVVCTIPLFSQVVTVARLESTLTSTPGVNILSASFSTNQPSRSLIRQGEQRLSAVITTRLRAYHVGMPLFELASQPVRLGQVINQSTEGITLHSLFTDQMQRQVRLVQGQLPALATDAIEIAVTQETLAALHAQLHS